MLKRKQGSIVNIASDVGVISPDHRIYEPNKKYKYKGVNFNTPISYSVAKAGIISLTRYLATYWALKGIRVNCISPAGVYKKHNKKFVEQLSHRIPLGRMAKPHELNGAIIYLCSNAWKATSLEAADNALIAMKNWNGLENLRNINNQTLIIWGDQDKAYNFNQVNTLNKNIPNKI